MALLTKSSLFNKARETSGWVTEGNIRNFSSESLASEKRAADKTARNYDIFLSHAFEDAIYIKAIRDFLAESGFSVYVDWIDDPQLDRGKVSKHTAAILRGRMNSCRCLLFATSAAAKRSLWMPWELGYMDARTGSRVAIAPIVEDSESNSEFRGQEYLGLYPYLDRTGGSFFIHSSKEKWVVFSQWIAGNNP